MAVSNYLYAGLKPLFIRELFTGYPLYTIRNIVYYPLEVLLMLELLIYSQKAGETLSKKISFPWAQSYCFCYGDCRIFYGMGFQTVLYLL